MEARIKFEIAKTIGNLDANFAELNNAVTEQVAKYKGLVYTDDQITEAKADLAALRSDRKLIDGARLSVKKEFMKPYDEFEKRVKETLGIYDSAITEIDSQVKSATLAEQTKKREEIENWWATNGVKSIGGISISQVWDDRYLNKGYTSKKWQEDLTAKVKAIEADLTTISFFETEMLNFVLPMYKKTLNLSEATAAYERFKADQKATEEARKAIEAKRAERVQEKRTETQIIEAKPVINQPVEVAEKPQEAVKTTHWRLSFDVKGDEAVIRKLSNMMRELKAEGLWFKVTDKESWEE